MILDIVHYSQGLCHWFYGKIHIWRKAPTYLACNYSKYSFFAMNMCNWKFHLQNELGLERFQGNFLSTCFWSIFQKKLLCIHIFDGAGTNWLKTWRPIVLLQEREVWNFSLKIFLFLIIRQKCPFYGRKRVHDNSACLPGYQTINAKAYMLEIFDLLKD